MGKPGGGRNEVDPRFISMFSVYNVTIPSRETLNYIYKSILDGHLAIFEEDVRSISETLVQTTLELYEVRLDLHCHHHSLQFNNLILLTC